MLSLEVIKEQIEQFVKKHNLIKVEFNDETNYPYYFDLTSYHRHPTTNKFYRTSLNGIYEALGNAQFRRITNLEDLDDKKTQCVPSGLCHSWSLLGCHR